MKPELLIKKGSALSWRPLLDLLAEEVNEVTLGVGLWDDRGVLLLATGIVQGQFSCSNNRCQNISRIEFSALSTTVFAAFYALYSQWAVLLGAGPLTEPYVIWKGHHAVFEPGMLYIDVSKMPR